MTDGRVVDKPVDHASWGRLRALYEWLKPATPSPHLPSSPASAPDRGDLPARIGQYAIERKLGQGGMGVVYAARDERLKRTVALKMMSSLANDERARTRFWREARVAASVNHPNVCQIYEISEDHGELFITMELLEGEALSERLRKGPLSIADALPIEFGILAALSALHSRGIVHRDLKPSNVFLGAKGARLDIFVIYYAYAPPPACSPRWNTAAHRAARPQPRALLLWRRGLLHVPALAR